MSKWPSAIVLAVFLTVAPQVSAAQSVVLARPPASDPTLYEAFGRLRAELELQGFTVLVLATQSTPRSAAELERASQERNAFAAVALQRDEGATAAEVLIVDRVTGKSTTRRLRIDPSPNGPTLLAVRATDLLRASLTEFAPGERPPKEVLGTESAPPSAEVMHFAKKPPRIEARAGGIALYTPELGVGAGPVFGASFRPLERLALGLEFCGPLLGARHETSNGVASVRQEFALFRVSWNLASASNGPHWEFGPVIGAGVYHLNATSVVSLPLVSRTDEFWSFVTTAGIDAQYVFAQNISLGALASAIALLPRPVIAVDDQRSLPIALQGRAQLTFGVAF